MWEEKGLLHNSQYAFRAKKGTEGPLLLWSLMNDRVYLKKEDQARGQGDLISGVTESLAARDWRCSEENLLVGELSVSVGTVWVQY